MFVAFNSSGIFFPSKKVTHFLDNLTEIINCKFPGYYNMMYIRKM